MQLLELKKNTSLATFAVSIFLALILGYFIALPKFNEWKQKSDNYKNLTDQLNTLNLEQAQVQSAIQTVDSNQSALASLNTAIPNNIDLPNLYAYLEYLAQNTNLQISSLSSIDVSTQQSDNVSLGQTAANAPTTQTIDGLTIGSPTATLGVGVVDIALNGQSNSLISFLSQLEKSRRFIDLQILDVANGQNGQTFRLSLKVYYELIK